MNFTIFIHRVFLRFCAAILVVFSASAAFATVLSGPQIASIPDQKVPIGKSLVVPVHVDSNGPVTISVSGGGGKVIPLVKTGDPFLKIHVDYAGTSGTDAFSGDMVFQLFRELTPKTVGYIGGFAQAGLYDGLTFDRVATLTGGTDGFIAQSEHPANGAPFFSYESEFSAPLIYSGRGQIGLANKSYYSNPYSPSNGADFFITNGNAMRHIDFTNPIFGQLVRDENDLLDKIMAVPTNNTQPTVNVTMTQVVFAPDESAWVSTAHDCTVFVSGIGITSGAGVPVTVTAISASGTDSKTFNVVAAQDIVNDPPFFKPYSDVVAPLHQPARIPMPATDLEFDYLQTNAIFLSGTSHPSGGINGNVITLTPNSSFPSGAQMLGVSVDQTLNASSRIVQGNQVPDEAIVNIGFGDARLTPVNTTLSSVAGSPMTAAALGTFSDADPLAKAGNFTATINWGDGTQLTSGSDVVITRVAHPAPTGFAISTGTAAVHTYANAGIYPLTITVSDSGGATAKIENAVVVTGSSSALVATGRSLTAGSGAISNRIVATFTDSSPGKPGDYTASIDWGDGANSTGKIRASRNGFAIYGSHKYTSNLTAAVHVVITKTSTNEVAHALSTAQPIHVPGLDVPPFPQAHFVASVSNVSPGNPPFLNASIFVLNTGNKAAAPVELKFFLSNDQTLDGGDTQLLVGLQNSLIIKSIAPGGSVSGTLNNIHIGTTTKDKYLILQVNYTDPIGDHMLYPRYFVSAKITN